MKEITEHERRGWQTGKGERSVVKTGGNQDKTRIRQKWGLSWTVGEILSSWAAALETVTPEGMRGHGFY